MLHRLRRRARWLSVACLVMGGPAAPAFADPMPQGYRPVLAPGVVPARPRPTVRTVVARRGQTIAQVLAAAGVERREVEPAVSALASVLPTRAPLPAGREVTLRQAPEDDALLAMTLEPQPGRTVTVTRTPTGWIAHEAWPGQRRNLVLVRGTIREDLLDDLRIAGLPDSLARQLVEGLAHELDFQRELRPGDSFTVLFERWRDTEGGLLNDGRTLHAGFSLAGRGLSLWRYDAGEGPDWFDDQGRSLRRSFLRTPLDGARVSSGFGMRRHPVLGYTRQHQGIDFAAPTGTPVLAAADGEVTQIRWMSGYGRIIELRHEDDRTTRYAHLSAFAPGLKPGDRVRQGEVIGKVGRTGLATGPHLHYELAESGLTLDPARARMRPATELAGQELAAFLAVRQGLAVQVAHLQPMQEVAAAAE
ncbi:peptidoglycan DD-metalloendopeptidase family protein [Paracraurococcus lichenis]|uniref:Peptidoglycan DD-metalloendopeptidase family protein n=1 Tax=Paracraurococcus lichenis TaxID=3064888 RepID=A0ABT9DUX8_9PROT|nr:peptidoglycan DD-metalloendopeptidase family protein [Paracraurococcus sp. LOR1-02]MDO9707705.1 peptidoglycan DD-metalloendopeptidase family protein [Paracraurococcus sp. LOR1-02]